MCPWPSICFHGPLGKFLDLLPPASLPPVQRRHAQHIFCSTRGHTPNNPSISFRLCRPQFPEVSKRGWRTEGVGSRNSFIYQRFRPLFCTLFPMPLQEKEDTLLENVFFCSFWRFVCLQPPPANPFSKPLKFGSY